MDLRGWKNIRDSGRDMSHLMVSLEQYLFVRQGTSTVADYITQFDDYYLICEVSKSLVMTITRFKRGLDLGYKKNFIITISLL